VVIALFTGFTSASAQENASNPLAAVNNTDLRVQPTTSDAGNKTDIYVDGAFMATPKLKLKYELHYNFTDVTGSNQQGFEKLVFKPIYLPSEGKLNENWGFRTAIGLDMIADLGDAAKGTSIGANQLGPFGGIALNNSSSGLTLIPLFQHYLSVGGGADISTSSGRLIAIQPFGDGNWLKLDAKVPYDWVNKTWPVTAEIQVGHNLNENTALYGDLLVGIGADRPYDVGFGAGLRFNY
jgi:hypothetical protein